MALLSGIFCMLPWNTIFCLVFQLHTIYSSQYACVSQPHYLSFTVWQGIQSSPFHLALVIAFSRLLIATLTMSLLELLDSLSQAMPWEGTSKPTYSCISHLIFCICWPSILKFQSRDAHLALSTIYYLIVVPLSFLLPQQTQFNCSLVILGFTPIIVPAISRTTEENICCSA